MYDEFECGKCGEHNDIECCQECARWDAKYDQLADRLRERDNEVWRLCRLLDENNIKYDVESGL